MSTSISIEFEFDLCTIAKEQNVQVSTRSDRVIVPYNLFFNWLRRNFRKAQLLECQNLGNIMIQNQNLTKLKANGI